MVKAPFFCISFDFELYWGVRDKLSLRDYGENILCGRRSVPLVLRLFKKYGISATWGVVGMSSFYDKKSLLSYLPSVLPGYEDINLCAYTYLSNGLIGNNEKDDPYHFGYSLVDEISQAPGMEIGSHSFSHFYAVEPRNNLSAYEADLKSSIAALNRFGAPVSSIIFCRNQYDKFHLETARKCGFLSFRGNENHNLNSSIQNDSFGFVRRVARSLDSYINLTGASTSVIGMDFSGLINVPSSRFFRPYCGDYSENLKLARIFRAMELAAISGDGFHLWWHPENFGKNLIKNLASLERVLIHFKDLNQRYGMVSKNMSQLTREFTGLEAT